MLAIKVYIQFKVDKLQQVLFKLQCLLWLEAVEDEEKAKLHAEAGKIGILALVVVNTADESVLPRLALALVRARSSAVNARFTAHSDLNVPFRMGF